MAIRYLPSNLTEAAECEVFMLPGLNCAGDGFIVGGRVVRRLEFAEWHLLEKSKFADDLQDFDADSSTALLYVQQRSVGGER